MQLPYLSVQDGGVCLGSACSLGCETLHMSLAESYPNIIRPMTPPQHGDDKAWDYLSESGAQILRDKTNVSFVVYRPMLTTIAIGSRGGTV